MSSRKLLTVLQFYQGIAEIAQETGLPDSMAIDEEHHLWVAIFNGGKVVRINPENGEITFEVVTPGAKQVTSCAFGGENFDALYITSANYQLSESQQEEQPAAGSLFMAKVPFKGVASFRFKG